VPGHSFKSPTSEDLDHDHLWRCVESLPERARIGIFFNRSYHEETLVVRVHPELLFGQKLPKVCAAKDIWDERFQDIRSIERYLTRNEEQQKRFLERLDNSDMNWKFSANDAKERRFWDSARTPWELWRIVRPSLITTCITRCQETFYK
jgi:polyphosphate kinase 2 (PPK2 family)